MALERRTGYKPDHESFGRFLLSEQARDPAVEAAHNIATLAQMRAPREAGPGPHMADQYKVNENPAPVTVGGNPRAIAEVYNDARRPDAEKSYAAASEFGRKGTEGHRTLGKAGAEIGEMRGQPG